jgi:uncharacterized membrane protein YdjX (TVP38/TMEM64 family)
MRLFLIFVFFVAIVLLSFFLWGDDLMEMFSAEGSVAWLQQYGSWAWVVAILLLISDLILPLPATIIMSAVGYTYGFFFGSLISVAGAFASGSLGYWICRSFGENAARKILGEKDFARGKNISQYAGGWIVVLSRWLPVFPEVVSCMAGLTRMNALKFHLALLTGTIPLGITYAYIGYRGIENPMMALVLSAALPPVIWLIATGMIKLLRRRSEEAK